MEVTVMQWVQLFGALAWLGYSAWCSIRLTKLKEPRGIVGNGGCAILQAARHEMLLRELAAGICATLWLISLFVGG